MNPLLAGGIIEAVGKIADDLFTSDKERMDAEIELRKLQLEEKRIDQAGDLAQVEVNKVEAANNNVFVAGWRPFAGWVCGGALAYVGMVEPIARFIAKVAFGYEGEFPVVDTELTFQVLIGMLGIGGLRTFEKTKGVAR